MSERLKGQVQISCESDVLGSAIFWTGPTNDVESIHNVVARALGVRVAQRGGVARAGMWTATFLPLGKTP